MGHSTRACEQGWDAPSIYAPIDEDLELTWYQHLRNHLRPTSFFPPSTSQCFCFWIFHSVSTYAPTVNSSSLSSQGNFVSEAFPPLLSPAESVPLSESQNLPPLTFSPLRRPEHRPERIPRYWTHVQSFQSRRNVWIPRIGQIYPEHVLTEYIPTSKFNVSLSSVGTIGDSRGATEYMSKRTGTNPQPLQHQDLATPSHRWK